MISNTVTLFRLALTLPLFLVLATGGQGWTALALFLGAGALDVLDGKIARSLNESSPLGAMLDLIGDRMLTLSAVAGLLIGTDMPLPASACALVLVARCQVVASLGEALGLERAVRASPLEPAKIALSFAGLGLAMSPVPGVLEPEWAGLSPAGMLLLLAAGATLVTIAGYTRQTVARLAA